MYVQLKLTYLENFTCLQYVTLQSKIDNMKSNKKCITSTGNKRLYQMGPIDATKLIAYPTSSISMLEGNASLMKKTGKKK